LGLTLLALVLVFCELAFSAILGIFGVMGVNALWQLLLAVFAVTAFIPVLYFLLVYSVFGHNTVRKKEGIVAALICFLVNAVVFISMLKLLMVYEDSGVRWFSQGSKIPGIVGYSSVLVSQFILAALLGIWTNRYPSKK